MFVDRGAGQFEGLAVREKRLAEVRGGQLAVQGVGSHVPKPRQWPWYSPGLNKEQLEWDSAAITSALRFWVDRGPHGILYNILYTRRPVPHAMRLAQEAHPISPCSCQGYDAKLKQVWQAGSASRVSRVELRETKSLCFKNSS